MPGDRSFERTPLTRLPHRGIPRLCVAVRVATEHELRRGLGIFDLEEQQLRGKLTPCRLPSAHTRHVCVRARTLAHVRTRAFGEIKGRTWVCIQRTYGLVCAHILRARTGAHGHTQAGMHKLHSRVQFARNARTVSTPHSRTLSAASLSTCTGHRQVNPGF